MSKRAYYRTLYGEGWKTFDGEKLTSAVADGFELDDPALPKPVTKATLVEYVTSLNERAKAAGATGEMEISDIVAQDKDGVLLEWTWWKFPGTDMEGAGMLKVTDDGVVYERIAYYTTP